MNLSDVCHFLESLQCLVIETGPRTGYVEASVNTTHLAECIATLQRACSDRQPSPAKNQPTS